MSSVREENNATVHIIIRHLPLAPFISYKRERPIRAVDRIPRHCDPRYRIDGPMRVSEINLGNRPRRMLDQQCMRITKHGV